MSDIILDNAEKVIAAFGGIRPMAKKLGVAVTTIQGWKERGTIPIARLDEIKAAAEREGIDLLAVAQAGSPKAGAANGAEKSGSATDPAPKDTAGSNPETAATRKMSGSVPKAGTAPADKPAQADTKSDAPKAARAERVRPAPDAGISAAEAAEPEMEIIEEEIVEYDERGWRTRTIMFGIGFGLAVVIGFVGAYYVGAFDQTASLSSKDRTAWEARFTSANDARAKIETQLTKVERQLAATTKSLATANASIAEMRKAMTSRTRALDNVRTQVAELAKRIDALPTTSGDTGAIAKLADRLREIEKQLSSTTTQDGKAVESLTRQNAQLRESLNAAQKRLAALETRVGRLAPGGGYGAMVIAIGQLRDTALSGRPFKAELARVRVLAKDYPEIIKLTEGLANLAEKGVANRTALVEGFGPAGVKMLSAAAKSSEGGIVDKTWGRLRSMVTIRRTGRDVTGTTPSALITRAENALADGKLGEALSLVGQLPASSRDAGNEWIGAATKRLQAETVLDKLQAAILKIVTGTGGTNSGGTNSGGMGPNQ